jgi:hypothetical protein
VHGRVLKLSNSSCVGEGRCSTPGRPHSGEEVVEGRERVLHAARVRTRVAPKCQEYAFVVVVRNRAWRRVRARGRGPRRRGAERLGGAIDPHVNSRVALAQNFPPR